MSGATGPAEAQRRINAWIAAGDPTAALRLANLGLQNGETPPIPDTVQKLYLGSNRFTVLPTLPRGLLRFDCSYSQVRELPPLPENLIVLILNQSRKLTQLPPLPATLRHLECNYCTLAGLPELPNGLRVLDCSFQQRGGAFEDPVPFGFRELPPLPPSLRIVKCSYVGLHQLPELPADLEELDCQSNPLGWYGGLPALPPTLITLSCENCELQTLPPLPPSLLELTCSSNILHVLPELPPTLRKLKLKDTWTRYLPRLPETLQDLDVGRMDRLEEPLRTWARRHTPPNWPYGGPYPDKLTTPEFIRLVNEWHDSLEPRAEGRNLARLAAVYPKNANTPANWYAGPQRATVEGLGMNNVRSVVGSMLTGRRGTLNQQRRQLQRQKNLVLREIGSRIYNAPGAGRRRRKTRRARSRKNRR
jgi:hypothetical protein